MENGYVFFFLLKKIDKQVYPWMDDKFWIQLIIIFIVQLNVSSITSSNLVVNSWTETPLDFPVKGNQNLSSLIILKILLNQKHVVENFNLEVY